MKLGKSLAIFLSGTAVSAIVLGAAVVTNPKGEISPVMGQQQIYTLTITSEDIQRGYALTTSGTHIELEHNDGVNVISSTQLVFSKNGTLNILSPINGSTSVSIVKGEDFTSNSVLTVFSGYSTSEYGGADELTSSHTSIDNTYYRPYFRFANETKNTFSVESISITYTCQEHYDFTPIMDTKIVNIERNKDYTYDGLRYEGDIGPDAEEVDVVWENNTINVDNEGDSVFTYHPVVKYYDKGGCFIKQATGLWVLHVDSLLRFFTSADEFVAFNVVYGEYFNKNKLYSGILSSFDWSNYAAILNEPITASRDFYPLITVNVNPGTYAEEPSYSTKFTPNPSAQTNYGFPDLGTPTVADQSYHFAGWYNGEDLYDYRTTKDFHDYDIYARYTSDFDLRLEFRIRGFHNPYLEVPVPENQSYTLTSDFVDQTTIGMSLGYHFEYVDNFLNRWTTQQGFWVYEEGHRDEGSFMAVGDTFTNDGKGTMSHPKTYVAEPFTLYDPRADFNYFNLSDASVYDKNLYTRDINSYSEHIYHEGKDEARTYYKKLNIPDSVAISSSEQVLPASWLDNGIISRSKNAESAADAHCITDSTELEVVIGNDFFENTGKRGFRNNTALKQLEYFPNLSIIGDYAFEGCSSLLPMQEWIQVDGITSIGTHAFDDCYAYYLLDEQGMIMRREIDLPSTLEGIGGVAFGGAIYTDFVVDCDSLAYIKPKTFAYDGDSNVHSQHMQSLLDAYNAKSEQGKAAMIPVFKALANHVIFHGSEEEYVELVRAGQAIDGVAQDYVYDEVASLTNYEFYVTFTK